MGQPADRIPGVTLVTDYGALDRALAEMARREAAFQAKYPDDDQAIDTIEE